MTMHKMTKPLRKQPASSILGFIDGKLTWSNHIAYLKNKLSRSVGLFYRIRECLSDSALKSL